MKPFLFIIFLCIQEVNAGSAEPPTDSTVIRVNKKVPAIQSGIASYYHRKFHGRLTASGQKYDSLKMTAAHNYLPMNTWIRVTNLRNNKSVIVRINDRLHSRNERIVDLSYKAAAQLGYVSRGLTKVKVEVLKNYKSAAIAASQL